MKNIKDRYKPYNFSSSRCHVIELIISGTGVTRIEAKLPSYIKTLTGIYISCHTNSPQKVTGFINVFFNEGAQKSLKLSVLNTKVIKHSSHPLPIHQELINHSTIQGYYLDTLGAGFPYTVKIYLHYKI
jgi:hypothetical protein